MGPGGLVHSFTSSETVANNVPYNRPSVPFGRQCARLYVCVYVCVCVACSCSCDTNFVIRYQIHGA